MELVIGTGFVNKVLEIAIKITAGILAFAILLSFFCINSKGSYVIDAGTYDASLDALNSINRAPVFSDAAVKNGSGPGLTSCYHFIDRVVACGFGNENIGIAWCLKEYGVGCVNDEQIAEAWLGCRSLVCEQIATCMLPKCVPR